MTTEIAENKRNENIVEYILMMWQCEDLVRAFEFDPLKLDEYISLQFGDESPKIKEETREWYLALLRQMKNEKLVKSGHTSELRELLTELIFLHNTLINITKNSRYIDLYNLTLPHLEEFKSKMDNPNKHPIEAYLQALYGMLLLKLQKKEISPATKESMNTFVQIMAFIAKEYKEMKTGLLDYSAN